MVTSRKLDIPDNVDLASKLLKADEVPKDPRVITSLYVNDFEDKTGLGILPPVVLVVSCIDGTDAPFVVNVVEPAKECQFGARLKRDQLAALVNAVIDGSSKLRFEKSTDASPQPPLAVLDDADGDVVVISDPGGGKSDGPKAVVLAALAVDLKNV